MVKNLPANAGDAGSIPGSEDPLEKGMATQSSIFAGRVPWTEDRADYSPWGCKESDTTECLSMHTSALPSAPPFQRWGM